MAFKPKSIQTSFISLLFMLVSLSSFSATLPDLGNESRLNLTETQERLLGTSWMQQIRASGLVSSDPLLNDYLNYLGHTLTAHTPRNQAYTFFWIEKSEQNAFTFFGGHIGVHFGMLAHVEDENQLAAVIAHELAHISQQHLLRQMTQNKRAMPITLAQMAAAIALGQPNLILAAMAGHGQKMINYTRDNEKEADRMGMQILANAGYDPQSMPLVFATMGRAFRYHDTPSEYLLTHPLFENRITDAQHRASLYPYRQKANSDLFYFAKVKVEVLTTNDLSHLIQSYKEQIQNKRYANQVALEYGLALAYSKIGKKKEAITILTQLAALHPHQLAVHLALAELEKIDHPKQALTRIKPFLRTHQYHSALLLLYADLLLQLEQPAEARRILKRYTSVLNQQPYTFDLLMRAENALHNKTGMLAAQAEIFALYGDLEQAHRTLTQAITFDDTKENNLSRLTQRRKEIEEMLAISRKF